MRRVLLSVMTTVDGFFEGPNREIDWHNVDAEFGEFAADQLDSADVLLFGRVTYELMASYWPTPAATMNDPGVAEKMNAKSKIVFSRTLERAEWQNTKLVREDGPGEIVKLKHQPGRDLLILGSSDLAVSFLKFGLIDEARIMVNPVVLGDGKRLFKGIENKLTLKLLKTTAFASGNVLLQYQPGLL